MWPGPGSKKEPEAEGRGEHPRLQAELRLGTLVVSAICTFHPASKVQALPLEDRLSHLTEFPFALLAFVGLV